MEDHVILVDENDREVGTDAKLAVHRSGRLHRAFSIFVFDSRGRTLLQRRATSKYHSGGLWSNTCCSHPRPGETVEEAARRRLEEEMGFDCALHRVCDFVYRRELADGFVEHEFDHVFSGHFDGTPVPDAAEVEAWRWADVEEVRVDSDARPERYTAWFGLALERLLTTRGNVS